MTLFFGVPCAGESETRGPGGPVHLLDGPGGTAVQQFLQGSRSAFGDGLVDLVLDEGFVGRALDLTDDAQRGGEVR